MQRTSIAAVVAEWRKAQGLTLQAASLRVGAGVATFHQWEDGTNLPSRLAEPGLAAALGMPVSDLAAMVARERKARLAGGRKDGRMGRGSHGAGSCRQIAKRAARRPGQVRP